MLVVRWIYILAIVSMVIGISYLLNGADRPNDVLWAKCIYNEHIIPCKLDGNKLFINGKESNVTKVSVTLLHNKLYVMIKDKL